MRCFGPTKSTQAGSRRWKYIAERMPNATTLDMPGTMDIDSLSILFAEACGFLRAEPSAIDLDSILATILFTDVVGSTERQASMGDPGVEESHRGTPFSGPRIVGALARHRERHGR
jgi:hypothetical protein